MTEYCPELGQCRPASACQTIEAGQRSAHILRAATRAASVPGRPGNEVTDVNHCTAYRPGTCLTGHPLTAFMHTGRLTAAAVAQRPACTASDVRSVCGNQCGGLRAESTRSRRCAQ
jgi:hypothetical protein